jgi:glycosyltransferase involved in cell wall biosynthesis
VYRSINEQFGVALLVEDLSPESLAAAINRLAHDAGLQEQLRRNCLAARTELNWEREEQRLLQFYQKLSPA